jgi:hypothetical protein
MNITALHPNSIYLCSELTVMVLQYTTLYTLYEFSHHTFCGNGTFIHLLLFILLIQAISEKYSILIFFYYILIIKKMCMDKKKNSTPFIVKVYFTY